MPAKPTHDLAVKAGEYQGRDGQSKARWQRIGTVFHHDDGGTSIKLDCVPVGLPNWDGWVSVFKREERQEGQGGYAQGGWGSGNTPQGHTQGRPIGPPTLSKSFDDDIPF